MKQVKIIQLLGESRKICTGFKKVALKITSQIQGRNRLAEGLSYLSIAEKRHQDNFSKKAFNSGLAYSFRG